MSTDDLLPRGWKAYYNEDDIPYYHHATAGLTQWERPSAGEFQEPIASSPDEPRAPSHKPESDELPNPWAGMTGTRVQSAPCRNQLAPWAPEPATHDKSKLAPWNTEPASQADSRQPRSVPAPPWSSFNTDRLGMKAGQDSGHIPCLLEPAVDNMLRRENRTEDGKYNGLYVDCTFGRGGHSRYILSKLSDTGRLIAFDVDPSAIAEGRKLEKDDARFRIVHRPFAELADEVGDQELAGVLMDLGVSSPQLDEKMRGFNLHENVHADMRMNPDVGVPAYQWLEQATVEELAWVIHEYGEDGDPVVSERIAEAIKTRQSLDRFAIRSTKELQDTVKFAKMFREDRGFHPAKLTFQAIRVFLNQEMQQLDAVLKGAFERLAEWGRCVIITFKQKEANAVKRFVREHEEPFNMTGQGQMSNSRLVELFPLIGTDTPYAVFTVMDPIRPSNSELGFNHRARSSAAHILQKRLRKWATRSVPVRPLCERFKKPVFAPVFTGEMGSAKAAKSPSSGSRAMSANDAWSCYDVKEIGDSSGKDVDKEVIGSSTSFNPPERQPDEKSRNPELEEDKTQAADDTDEDGKRADRSAEGPARPSQHLGDFQSDSTREKPIYARSVLQAASSDPAPQTLENGLPLPKFCRATCDYESSGSGYLQMSKGEELEVLLKGCKDEDGEDSVGWFWGFSRAGRPEEAGWFPQEEVILLYEV
eukprot:TRINITY_DN58511_c0_g1_i1.p1 TRINITY_DN58511_c0_g1~~TRINITY_DN58511_c0_g1_i1.p1  ORF type:complete len:711 (+),score=120.68 TRINITY_DN58511_c0_g1_i1:27-2135(+)